jgi:hypothetical protein
LLNDSICGFCCSDQYIRQERRILWEKGKDIRRSVEYRESRLVVLTFWKGGDNLRGDHEKSTESNIELDPRVREAVLKAAPEGRITCPAARELADRLGVDPSVIGEACNQLRIKIKGCALGCFR